MNLYFMCMLLNVVASVLMIKFDRHGHHKMVENLMEYYILICICVIMLCMCANIYAKSNAMLLNQTHLIKHILSNISVV